ncbi:MULTISPECIES: acetate/propionate family kinase [unclassified Chelatococcus]|uniref:acetate/propionate family kinase n=1 Tax=unclassified Chelatococcus TaxID=2638111 RepID=UPI001BCDE083|nr:MULTISPECIES: acetate/propionate family kinase [unclassified Chelatococcus]CAH1648017.1 Acetate kinase [Hyphomicrobiales bacterium]MBS7742096.1 acetate/propionate family kinase [Chelatococcus sp. HY11]MBX3542786.1 acetate/propionate family kinase [Chelatococcus sp.]MCO5074999.1 acetate/propionate family kinase [Chelatococcus sp.]CAH1690212.1 Acetate kinase [Hyphomicrobiales bacterium]
MSDPLLLTFNAGSSTVKIGLFRRIDGRCLRIGKGTIDFRRRPLTFHLTEGPAVADVTLAAAPEGPLEDVLAETFRGLAQHFDMGAVTAVAHRVVHGGDTFSRAVLIDDTALDGIAALTPLAPLHQPQCVRLIRAIRQLHPALPQTASFDTAFHGSQSDVVRRFALPRMLHDAGVKRYGFHGLSYAFIARELARVAPAAAKGKVVAAHLGSGASLCALDGGVSRDTSMGFSTLDGIPMATRCGALDPGVILYLLEDGSRSLAAVNDILYKQSGLLGMSGISADSRELLASDRPEAREALEVFAFRIAGEIARLAATLGGLDAVVFTAGVGENQPWVRAAVAARLEWLGLALDGEANAANAVRVSAAMSRVAAFVIPTDEEQVIADEAESVLAATTRA